MKKLLVLVFALITLSLVSCSCGSNGFQKGQVWSVYPSGKPTDSLLFLILDVKKDKDDNKWVNVENLTNGGTSLENYSKFRGWVQNKISDKPLAIKKVDEPKKVVEETSVPVELSNGWDEIVEEFGQ